MKLFEKIINKEEKLAVVGLGYVGMPIAVSFAKHIDVIGYDNNKEKIQLYKSGIDPTKEVGNDVIAKTTIHFTHDESDLKKALFFIVAVPTPVNQDTSPDLSPVISASQVVGRNLSKGSIVVYESTVYPGVTEEICVPILEKESGLKCGQDFKVGYSPERINPGDHNHRLENIVKIVSGMDADSLDEIANVYQIVVKAGVYRAQSIKVAEAAKVIENCQRDINIAFMNELSIIFHMMDIDTKSVLDAASTKWNFLKFYPGLVGGHCIGVDPYYLTYKAQTLGYHSQVILSGRRINDGMGQYIASKVVKMLVNSKSKVHDAKIGILGFTFKENCPDARNSKVYDIITGLREYGINPVIYDPIADKNDVAKHYDAKLSDFSEMSNLDALIVAVSHDEFKNMTMRQLKALCSKGDRIPLIDVKGIFDANSSENAGFAYWRL